MAEEVKRVIPNPETTPYRAAFEKLQGLEQQTSGTAWTSERVAEMILRVMQVKRPRPRYVAMTNGGIALLLLTKLLPTRLVDKFWQRFYGLDRVAGDWRAHLNRQE